MSEYLMRDGAPLSEEVWEQVDEMVVSVMKKVLVGRRFIPMVGPLGWGTEVAPTFGFSKQDGGAIVDEGSVGYVPLGEMAEEFVLTAKRMAVADSGPYGLDLGAVAMAATNLAKAENTYLIEGLIAGATKGSLGDWDQPGNPFSDISKAIAGLRGDGVDGPFAVVMGPTRYAQLASLMRGMGRRELDLVEKLADDGVFQYVGLDDKVLVLSPQSWNMDLVVGQDAVTAYLGNEGLDHRFRIFETMVLRVKRGNAVCVLG